MKIKSLLVVTVVASLTTGCASIINGTNDTVSITSDADTSIYVDGNRAGRGDITIPLKRGKTHIITAKKEGCFANSIETQTAFDKTSLLGILIDFGIVSIPLDFAIGGASEISPRIYNVEANCSGNA
ncbi:hypothetical protein [Zobellella aerophila]|uniref:PEGA domain-containing protein n=1 Tax=Zobellella aerophila TaxID=870480 RepID=A0ABP6W5F2_9GAMM